MIDETDDEAKVLKYSIQHGISPEEKSTLLEELEKLNKKFPKVERIYNFLQSIRKVDSVYKGSLIKAHEFFLTNLKNCEGEFKKEGLVINSNLNEPIDIHKLEDELLTLELEIESEIQSQSKQFEIKQSNDQKRIDDLRKELLQPQRRKGKEFIETKERESTSTYDPQDPYIEEYKKYVEDLKNKLERIYKGFDQLIQNCNAKTDYSDSSQTISLNEIKDRVENFDNICQILGIEPTRQISIQNKIINNTSYPGLLTLIVDEKSPYSLCISILDLSLKVEIALQKNQTESSKSKLSSLSLQKEWYVEQKLQPSTENKYFLDKNKSLLERNKGGLFNNNKNLLTRHTSGTEDAKDPSVEEFCSIRDQLLNFILPDEKLFPKRNAWENPSLEQKNQPRENAVIVPPPSPHGFFDLPIETEEKILDFLKLKKLNFY